jgi:hypothetical protein
MSETRMQSASIVESSPCLSRQWHVEFDETCHSATHHSLQPPDLARSIVWFPQASGAFILGAALLPSPPKSPASMPAKRDFAPL